MLYYNGTQRQQQQQQSLFICNWQKIDFNWFPFHGYWTTNKWPSDVSRKLWQIKHSLETTMLACCRFFSLSLSLSSFSFSISFLIAFLFRAKTVWFKCIAYTHRKIERMREIHFHRNQSNINFSRSMVWFILCECACQFSFFIFTWQPFLPCHYWNSCDFALQHFKLTEEQSIVEFLFPFCIMHRDLFLLVFFLLILFLCRSFSLALSPFLVYADCPCLCRCQYWLCLCCLMLMLLRNSIQFSIELKSSMPIIPKI